MPTVSGFTVQIADRVRETTGTNGTGTYSLNGAATGFRSFVSGVGSGNRCCYTAALGSSWEVGIGLVTSGGPATLTRDLILASSNSNNAVNWGAGTKDIFCTAAAGLLTQIFPQPTLPELRTTIATTSGSFHEYTGIIDTATQVTLMFDDLGTNGTNPIHIRLGDATAYQTTGYDVTRRGSTTTVRQAAGFTLIDAADPADGYTGTILFTRKGSNVHRWHGFGLYHDSRATPTQYRITGLIALTSALTRIRVTTLDTFDSGSIGLMIQ